MKFLHLLRIVLFNSITFNKNSFSQLTNSKASFRYSIILPIDEYILLFNFNILVLFLNLILYIRIIRSNDLHSFFLYDILWVFLHILLLLLCPVNFQLSISWNVNRMNEFRYYDKTWTRAEKKSMEKLVNIASERKNCGIECSEC